MGMDLKVECHHCGSAVGVFCKESCIINGKHIKRLRVALNMLDIKVTKYE